jgi:putative ABC transport system substrate-binding protein
MRRREFMTLLSGAVALPLSARAQQPALPVIGILTSVDVAPDRIAIFRQILSAAGYADGEKVTIELRSAKGQYDRLPELAGELVARRVAVIVAWGGPAAVAAKSATAVVPIVFMSGADPVAHGVVQSLDRPGGNASGIYMLYAPLEAKRLELLRALVPNTSVLAVLVNPTVTSADQQLKDLYEAAHALGVELRVFRASSESEIDAAFANLIDLRIAAISVGSDPFFFTRCGQIVALAARHAVPAIHAFRECSTAGGLMSYAPSVTETLRLAGVYVVRILKGERPADLPVQQSTKVELVLNLKTANALGINFPLSLLGRADEVIE